LRPAAKAGLMLCTGVPTPYMRPVLGSMLGKSRAVCDQPRVCRDELLRAVSPAPSSPFNSSGPGPMHRATQSTFRHRGVCPCFRRVGGTAIGSSEGRSACKTAPRRQTRGLRFRFSMNWICHGELAVCPSVILSPGYPVPRLSRA